MKIIFIVIAAMGTICFPPPPDPDEFGPDLIVYLEPQFPRSALEDCIEGWVTVRVYVGSDGSVAFATILDSMPKGVFDEVAMRTIYRWKFRTQTEDGEPVALIHDFKLEFDPDEYLAPEVCTPKLGV